MRILVIEDEAKTAEFLKKGLGPADHRGLRPGVESNPRAVNAPSKWQTRQPIYRSSVARGRRYEPFLGPLRALFDV